MRFPGKNADEAQPCGSPTLGDQGEDDGPAKEADVAGESVEILIFVFSLYFPLSSHSKLIARFYYSWLQASWQGLT